MPGKGEMLVKGHEVSVRQEKTILGIYHSVVTTGNHNVYFKSAERGDLKSSRHKEVTCEVRHRLITLTESLQNTHVTISHCTITCIPLCVDYK